MEADKAGGKFGRALELALLMAYVALNSDYQVQLVPFGPSPSEEVGQSIRLVHPSQIFGLAKTRLLNWRPEGQTNFEHLGDQSLRWRRAGASVVVLSDFLIDVDDEAISRGPQNPSWFRPSLPRRMPPLPRLAMVRNSGYWRHCRNCIRLLRR